MRQYFTKANCSRHMTPYRAVGAGIIGHQRCTIWHYDDKRGEHLLRRALEDDHVVPQSLRCTTNMEAWCSC